MKPIINQSWIIVALWGLCGACDEAEPQAEHDAMLGSSDGDTDTDVDGDTDTDADGDGSEQVSSAARTAGPCEAVGFIEPGTADGVRTPFQRTIFEYFDDGFPSRTLYDWDYDGNFDLTERYADGLETELSWYPSRVIGVISASEWDQDDDGTVDRRDLYERDPSGRVSMHAVDTDGDGQYEYIENSTYSDTGVLLSNEIDNGGDGVVDTYCYVAVDTRGNPELRTCDSGIHRWYNTYDDRDNLLRAEYDAYDDGTIDAVNVNAFDDMNRLTYTHMQSDTVETEASYEYDDAGRIVQEVSSQLTAVDNSNVTVTRQLTYYDNGNPASETRSWSGGSVLISYNEAGIKVRKDASIGTYEAHEQYLDDGRPIELDYQDRISGEYHHELFSYDALGKLVLQTSLSSANAFPSTVTEYYYDCR